MLAKILLLTLITYSCLSQTAEPVNNDLKFVQPVVVQDANSIPATQIPIQGQPLIPNNNQPKTETLHSNPSLHGIEPNSVPVDQPSVQQPINPEKPQMNQQAMAKAKQQADRAQRLAEQARRQAEIDRKSRDQKEDQQLRNIKLDQTISKTERKKQEERLMFRKTARIVEDGTKFTEYLFEQGLGSSEFFIKIPATQQVALNFYTYVAQDNTYVRTKNIEQEEPVRIYIYENNQHVVYEGEFFYQTYIVFQGQANAMYLIRVVNNGRTKLISMNSKKLVEESHLSATLQKTDGQHVERTQNLAIDINKWYQEFRKIRMLDFQDLKAAEGYIEKFYSWEIIETIVAVVLCLVQVNMIQKMLKGNTIV